MQTIKNDPLAFVLLLFPWGEPGTPLEHFQGPRKWQRGVIEGLYTEVPQIESDRDAAKS